MDNMLPYLSVTNVKDITDLDTLERVRSVSESSMCGTSGYNSTTSSGPDNSPNSNRYSPVQSPDSFLHTEFSQLAIPQQNSLQYVQLQNMNMNIDASQSVLYQQNMNFSPHLNFNNSTNYQQCQQSAIISPKTMHLPSVKYEYEATLRVTEQPVEKFRFRYKSEMHGTHGSLNGTTSQRNIKRFPEVELCGYKRPAIIRCSLFQTNRDSPHSHQLVVRKDDHDICDPHEVKVSQDVGYFAEFKNMGIIHTAKKFIVEELYKKKRKRLGRDFLTTKEDQDLHKQTEKEAKDMNLNQVRLCFEAFRVEQNNSYTPIALPVYSNAINNRKSAQTGELRIVHLSIATGSVAGGDDLILLVEKVSKKNIKVRFYEMAEDEQVWEAFASFRESDVHHQYAIVCRTPPYRDRDIDKAVEVFIELVRPSDDERSYPSVTFRYKPTNAAISRKRRRTCSSLNSGSCNNSGSVSSGEIPKTVQEQQNSMNIDCASTELKSILNNTDFNKSDISIDSGLLAYLEDPKLTDFDAVLNNAEIEGNINRIEKDGICIASDGDAAKKIYHYKKQIIIKKKMDIAREGQSQSLNVFLQRILNIFQDTIRSANPVNAARRSSAGLQINKIINEHSEKYGESLIHEIVLTNNKLAIPIFKVLAYFKLNELLNTLVNKQTQTALHYACLHDQPNYIRPLLKLGCNPNIQDSDGNTALHIAVAEKHMKCVESFLNSGINLNINDLNDQGFTPLHLAIRDNNYDIVAKLLQYDATIVKTSSNKDGSNALHMAVQQQNLKLVNLFLEKGQLMTSVLYASNRAGYTPLDLAKQLVTADDQGKDILNVLLSFSNKYPLPDKTSEMDISPCDNNHNPTAHNIVIKEEDNSGSSTEDEEENNSGTSSVEWNKKTTATVASSLPKPKIIKEENIDNDDEVDIITITDLEMALNDKETLSKLCMELNNNEKWKMLAMDMELPYFYLTNAEAFLNSLKRNIKSISCLQLTLALKKINKTLVQIIKK